MRGITSPCPEKRMRKLGQDGKRANDRGQGISKSACSSCIPLLLTRQEQ